MDSHDFVVSDFGEPARVGGPGTHVAYFPKPMPRTVALDEATWSAMSTADRAIGRLAGAGRQLKNPLVIANLYLRREAISSTRIEGTQATLDDLYEAETGGEIGSDVREVINYVDALYRGLEDVGKEGITLDLIKTLHIELLKGVRGDDKRPGVVREGPNWIGSNDPATAKFVPPPHTELDAGLADWVAFAGEDLPMPPLIKCALLHYQFETLHPFFDGNGRLGRLLIILYVVHNEHLPAPLLYLSPYFEQNKQAYYDALQGVRERGDILTWLRYFLAAVTDQANDAVRRSERLWDIGDDYRKRLSGSRSRAHEVIDVLLFSPWITTQQVKDRLGVSSQGATNLLRQLESVGIVTPARGLPGRSNRWVATEAMKAVRD